jgi:hypothetical protein
MLNMAGCYSSWLPGERVSLYVGRDILSNFGGCYFVDVKCYTIQAILEVSGVCFVQNRICQYYKMYSVTTQLIYACNLAPSELSYHEDMNLLLKTLCLGR